MRVTGAVVYCPSPVASTVPDQTGGVSQRTASRVGKGPYRAALTVAFSSTSPLTMTVSVSAVPGRTWVALTLVSTLGWRWTTNVSAATPQGVVTGARPASPAMTSWYV